MSWWLWQILAVAAFVLGIAVGALSYWLAETSGPMASAAIAALGASLVLSYLVAPVMAIKGIIELLRLTRGPRYQR